MERRVEELALELAGLLRGLDPEAREELREYVVDLLREQEVSAEAGNAVETAAAGTFNALGVGIPVFLMGAVLLAVFPPVGLLLVGVAVILLVWGLAAALLSRH